LAQKKKKIFVLDTNVILHDSSCISQFMEHDIVLPITVLEELDQFKKGNGTLNYHAREFLRSFDSISGDKLFGKGVSIGPGHGKISVRLEQDFHEDLKQNFPVQNPDHHILNIAYQIAKEHPAKQVILISKDVNLRMKAKAVGMTAQNYTSDQVKDISSVYKGSRIKENISPEVIEQFFRAPFEAEPASLDLKEALQSNEYLIIRNGKKSVLGVFDPVLEKIRRVNKSNVYGIMPRNAEHLYGLRLSRKNFSSRSAI